MTTPDRLPTPDLLGDGHCVHAPANWGYCAVECSDCIALALSRARDEGIEAAAQAASQVIHCPWCAPGEHSEWCTCEEERAPIYRAVHAIKENRPR